MLSVHLFQPHAGHLSLKTYHPSNSMSPELHSQPEPFSVLLPFMLPFLLGTQLSSSPPKLGSSLLWPGPTTSVAILL